MSEDTVVVKPYNRSSLGWFGLCLLFVTIFTYVLVDARSEQGVHVARWMIGFWGPLAALFGVFLLPGSTYVRADANGIECRMFWISAFRLAWSDIERITPINFPSSWGIPRFGFAYISLSAIGREKMKHSFFQKMTKGKLGINVGIPHLLGSPRELAEVLNERKQHFEH